MRNIRPWCISRQLWWGHQLPVWYRGNETYVGMAPPEGDGWERDPDVLDTWFSSALWPFATLGWPDETPELRRFYPTHVLSTARDIIFLWVARMVMMGIEYMGEVPFRDVYVHSVIQAPDGRRMSKSLGTGIDPLDLIAVHGADAVRFGLLLMASQQDVRFNEERVRQGRQLVTKLWNATRLVVDRGGAVPETPPSPETLADRWIASRVAAAADEAERLVAAYEFSALADLVYHVIFDDFCDWYLELLKVGEGTPAVAGHVLEQLLALAHPVMPFVTEECWSRLPGAGGLMLTHPLPVAPGPRDQEAEAAVGRLQEAVTALRAFRAEGDIPSREDLSVTVDVGVADGVPAAALSALGRVRLEDGVGAEPQVIPLSFGRLRVRRTGGAVDVEAERDRLAGAIGVLEREIARAEGMLGNPRFVDRAPEDVVTKEREKLARFTAEREELSRRLSELR
jgi:valyl-tRNA synthetase